jgi:hypothetical protein
LRKLRNLKWLMISSRLGAWATSGALRRRVLRNSYPEAYEVFEEELDV